MIKTRTVTSMRLRRLVFALAMLHANLRRKLLLILSAIWRAKVVNSIGAIKKKVVHFEKLIPFIDSTDKISSKRDIIFSSIRHLVYLNDISTYFLNLYLSL